MNRFPISFTVFWVIILASGLVFSQQDTTLTITSEGNVGIGTSTPEVKLEVTDNVLIRSGGFEGNAAGASSGLEVRGTGFGAGITLDNGTQQWIITSWSDNSLVFNKSTGSSFNPFTIKNNSFQDALVIGANGIGIGTENPSRDIHIFKDVNAATGIRLQNPNNGSSARQRISFDNEEGTIAGIQIWGSGANSSNQMDIFNNRAGGKINLHTGGGGLTIANSGNVGIGTTNPLGTLDVNGSIYQRGNVLHADYVFEPDYQLESIEAHAAFMWKNKHLKAIPKAKTDEAGREILEVGAHRKGIVEELEKAHIYIDQLHHRIKTLEEQLTQLASQFDSIN
jgi:hypothetical protein